MNDLISRQAAIAHAISGRVRCLSTSEDGESWIRVSEVRESLLNMPSAEPERKKGKWELRTDEKFDIDYYKCSECGYEPYRKIDISNFCPNCGADMRGESE